MLADEIEDARALSERELSRLSRKYSVTARNGEPLITSIVLTGGDLVLSSLSAQAIETLVERPLPSAHIVSEESQDEAASARLDAPEPV